MVSVNVVRVSCNNSCTVLHSKCAVSLHVPLQKYIDNPNYIICNLIDIISGHLQIVLLSSHAMTRITMGNNH